VEGWRGAAILHEDGEWLEAFAGLQRSHNRLTS
jgi:hypothetical protein